MTISLAWFRRNNNTTELIFASDSRLRSRGAIDECQKLFPLSRGDCCLGFCGDAQIAYPLFMQVSSTLDNYFGTSSRATDVTDLVGMISVILKQLISSWDLPRKEKLEELQDAKILFGGWSWKFGRFDLGAFELSQNCEFVFHHRKFRIGHPWYERSHSLLFLGDYEEDYRAALVKILEKRHARDKRKNDNPHFDFDYEPIEALQSLLKDSSNCEHPAIGGSPQLVKVYRHGNTLPYVIRSSERQHFLFGRRLLKWEKSEHPILDLAGARPKLFYPMGHIPLPSDVTSRRHSDRRNTT